MASETLFRSLYHVYGLVQGVGFRPFVATLAVQLRVEGYVKNLDGIVEMYLVGDREQVDKLLGRLMQLDGKDPELPGARVIRIEELSDRPTEKVCGFKIRESSGGHTKLRILPPDMATCPECRKELFDPGNRRFRYPFISCSSCGPRYSILRRVPFDRENTSMDIFPMCHECGGEYLTSPRRRHAQTISCPVCGPKLLLIPDAGKCRPGEEVPEAYVGDDALMMAVRELKLGKIIAVKDIGGFHLACRALDKHAVQRIQAFKKREGKALAVMLPDIELIKQAAFVSEQEEELLLSSERPILLLTPKPGENRLYAKEVNGDSPCLGAMLPSNPLQELLVHDCGPLVMTSANHRGGPIITSDEEMVKLAAEGACDHVLTHNREVLHGLDDSIYQVTGFPGRTIVQVLRRARGIVPLPVFMSAGPGGRQRGELSGPPASDGKLPEELSGKSATGGKLPEDHFAAGSDLKAVFGFARGQAVFLSGHFGDLQDAVAEEARKKAVSEMKTLLDADPKWSVCDLAPNYISSNALGREEKPVSKVQHHYAHILSVMAEHGVLEGKVLGVAYDGTGYGTDGTIWGGEFLLCGRSGFERLRSLTPIVMPGGDITAKNGDVVLACYLNAAMERGLFPEEEARRAYAFLTDRLSPARVQLLSSVIRREAGTVRNSSMGRLFDAAAALLDISRENTYEGRSAMALQSAAERYLESGPGEKEKHRLELLLPYTTDTPMMMAELFCALGKGFSHEELAYAFHYGVAGMTAEVCAMFREIYGAYPVALSGGCFANRLLLKLLLPMLAKKGMTAYLNGSVPCGDGGLALGQAYYLG